MGISINEVFKHMLYPSTGVKEIIDETKEQEKKYPFVFHADKFYEGMTKEDASKLDNNIFINYQKEFERIDSGDGVLSAKEIEYAAYEDEYNGKTCACSSFAVAGITGGLYTIMKKNPLGKALLKATGPKIALIGLAATMTLCGIYGIITAVKARNIAQQYKDAG